jgi:general secretion pathway protein B
MSFILDALKKSEAERARQAGPALLEMRIVRPRRRVGLWIVMLVVLLGINLAVLLWYVLRQPEPAASSTASVQPATAPPVAATPPASAVVNPPASVMPPAALPPPAAFVADPGAPIAGANATENAISDNPADFEPAASITPGSVRVERSAAVRPNYNEISGRVPELRLDLHVYAPRPQDRYALINMHKMKEGDRLPEGPRVVEITRDGVVLEWQGSEFMLGRE